MDTCSTTDLDGKILKENLPTCHFPDIDKRENLILSKTKETFTANDAEYIINKKHVTVSKYLKNLHDKGCINKAQSSPRITLKPPITIPHLKKIKNILKKKQF